MEKEKLHKILLSYHNDAISVDDAWKAYQNVIQMCRGDEFVMIFYLYTICKMDSKKRLIWRQELAEKGIELTPGQLDQYVRIINLALEHEMKDSDGL
tara:strand:- start:153 stop:443 length:291 start_codon:yes stop_codon:yes gene_type:complete